MIAFWAVAGILSAAAAVLILARAARAGAQGPPVDPSPALYRRQLSEIGELADRGLLGEAERKAAEAEAGRRLLTAADHQEPAWSTTLARGPLLAAAIAAPALALGIYLLVGSPGLHDQSFESRIKGWKATPTELLTPAQVAAVLGYQARLTPNDPELFRYLAIFQSAAGEPGESVRAVRRAVKLAPQRADLWSMLGIALVDQAGGVVTDDAKDAFEETLKRDPKSFTARFYVAEARMKAGETAQGLADWKALLAELPADNPNRANLQAAIAQAEGAPAPVQAMAPPTLDAIKGMVAGLAARLKAQPDDPEGWVRLVRAYAVLGEPTERDAALAQARARYAKQPQVLQALDEAAKAAPMR